MTMTESPRNRWRQDTPGAAGWTRTARPDDPDKYYMVSADCHAQEPSPYLAEYIDPEFRHRIPHVERREDGSEYIITEGGMKGLRGFFTRDDSGAVVGVDLAGRLFNRVPAASQ